MAVTSPDNIWTPDSGDDYALTVDLAATADTIQDALTALNSRFPASVANPAARDALFPTPVHGNRVFRNDLAAEEVYLGVYNATTNPSGVSSPGWYPTKRVFFANRGAAQSIANASWTQITTAYVQVRNDGIGTFSGGSLTVTAGGTYRLSASVYFATAANPNSIQITRNSTTADTSATLAAGIVENVATRGGFAVTNIVQLSAGDVIRVLAFSGGTANSVATTLGVSGATFSVEKL